MRGEFSAVEAAPPAIAQIKSKSTGKADPKARALAREPLGGTKKPRRL